MWCRLIKECNSLKKFLRINKLSKAIIIRHESFAYFFEIEALLKSKNFNESISIITEIEKWLKINGNSVNTESKMALFYNLAVIFFIKSNFNKSLNWINKVLNLEHHKQLRLDIQIWSRFLNLFIHIELKNHQLVRYYSDSIYRYLKLNNKLHNFEKILLDFTKNKIENLLSKKEHIEAYKELENQLSKEKKSILFSYSSNYYIFLWIKSKISEKPILEIIK